jgi:Peptidase C10 family/Carboxypeptidase regulatory-like domain/Spi protease inhibitor
MSAIELWGILRFSTLRLSVTVLALGLPAVMGSPVSTNDAVLMTKGWMKRTPTPLRTAFGDRELAWIRSFAGVDGTPLYHVISLRPEGFVIAGADNEVEPIIAFSDSGDFDRNPGNPLFLLVERDTTARLAVVRGGAGLLSAKPGAAREKWSRLLAGEVGPQPLDTSPTSSVDDPRVDPFVKTHWNQSTIWNGSASVACYNYYTPPLAAGSVKNYVCGCNNTAWAQVLRYFQYPTVGVGTASWDISVDGTNVTRKLRGGDGLGGPYRWDLMVAQPGAGATVLECQAIGALTADIGSVCQTSYAPGGSSAGFTWSLVEVFHLGGICHGYGLGDSFDDDVNASLNARLPVVLGIRSSAGGHAVVCDGYGFNQSTPYRHLNFGWGGQSDAWYNLPNIGTVYGFNVVDEDCYNIYTNANSNCGEILSGRVTGLAGKPATNAVVHLAGGSVNRTVATDARGIYAFSQVPGSATYAISVSAPGLQFTPLTVTVSQSGSFLGAPNRWGLDFAGVLQNPAPSSPGVIHGGDLTRSAAAATIRFNTAAGTNYVLEFKNSLVDMSWQAADQVAGDGSVCTLTDTNASASRRFYRVRPQ